MNDDEEDRAHARGSDPWTSHEAAATVKVTEHQMFVLILLDHLGPSTDERLVDNIDGQFPMTPQSARSRRCQLVRMGLVEPCGVTTMRTNRRALIWQLTDAGRAFLRKQAA